MKVKVKLFKTLIRHCKIEVPEDEFELELSSNSTAGDLLEKLGLSTDLVKVIVVNNQKATPSDKLKSGDNVRLFPLIAGG